MIKQIFYKDYDVVIAKVTEYKENKEKREKQGRAKGGGYFTYFDELFIAV